MHYPLRTPPLGCQYLFQRQTSARKPRANRSASRPSVFTPSPAFIGTNVGATARSGAQLRNLPVQDLPRQARLVTDFPRGCRPQLTHKLRILSSQSSACGLDVHAANMRQLLPYRMERSELLGRSLTPSFAIGMVTALRLQGKLQHQPADRNAERRNILTHTSTRGELGISAMT